jgi:hypothetical protein
MTEEGMKMKKVWGEPQEELEQHGERCLRSI